jgi:predicted O-linked N-acetylglucosamine transferase (SPINDLY family)
MDDAEAAGLLAREDLLLDLNGHTQGSRLRLLGARAAAVSTLVHGYPGTMGGGLLEYVLTDSAAAGPSTKGLYAERLVLLPGFFLATDHAVNFRHLDAASSAGRRAADDADEEGDGGDIGGGLTLSSFSQPYKLEPHTLAAWVNVLHRTGGRSLQLLRFQDSSELLVGAEVAALGLHRRRLRLLPLRPRDTHLQRAAAAHLSLDTPGYNQGTSGLDALWAGLPMATLPMQQWCARMGLGLLRAVGLPQTSAVSLRAFEDMVVAIGGARRPPPSDRSTPARRPLPPSDGSGGRSSSSLDHHAGHHAGEDALPGAGEPAGSRAPIAIEVGLT